MLDVREVTYTPTEEGPEVRTSLSIGTNEVSSSRMLGPGDELSPILDKLMIRIEQVTFVQTESGPEIQASMRMGDRSFVSAWAMEPDDTDLRAAFDHLLRTAGNTFLSQLQTALTGPAEPVGASAE